MKYIKTYEGIFQKVKEFFYDAKLAKALQRFVNSINPELKCTIKADTSIGGYKLISKDNNFGYNQMIHVKSRGNEQDITVFLFHCNDEDHEDLNRNIADYILSIGNSDIITFDVKNEDVPDFISKLNIDDFNLYTQSTKYNL